MKSERPPRASMRGASGLLRDILHDLGNAPARQAPVRPSADKGLAPDPEGEGPRAELGDVLERLDERAFGLMLLLLALPCCLPFVYVLPQIVSAPMAILATQMAIGRTSPWLPAAMRRRSFAVAGFRNVLDRSEKYLRWLEALARPRLRPVTGHGASRIIGALLIAPCLSIMTPLPGTNTVPGIGVAIVALGLIERDGVLVIVGLFIALAWVVLLLTLGLEAATLIKDWFAAAF